MVELINVFCPVEYSNLYGAIVVSQINQPNVRLAEPCILPQMNDPNMILVKIYKEIKRFKNLFEQINEDGKIVLTYPFLRLLMMDSLTLELEEYIISLHNSHPSVNFLYKITHDEVSRREYEDLRFILENYDIEYVELEQPGLPKATVTKVMMS